MASPTPDLTDASSPSSTSKTTSEPPAAREDGGNLFFPDIAVKQEDDVDSGSPHSATILNREADLDDDYDGAFAGQLTITTQDRLNALMHTVDVHFKPETEQQIQDEVRNTTFDHYFLRDAKMTARPLLKLLKEEEEEAKMIWQIADQAKAVAKLALDAAEREMGNSHELPESVDHGIKHIDAAAKQAVKWRMARRHTLHKIRSEDLKRAHKKELEDIKNERKKVDAQERIDRRTQKKQKVLNEKNERIARNAKKLAARRKRT